jgi:predicted metal-dependent phosphotriesterase family hydrolase
MGLVRTVLGDVDGSTLGHTYCHEHLLTAPGEQFTVDGPDMVLDDEDKAARELEIFKSFGGGTLVEVSTPEIGRNVIGLRRLSERTGVHVICSTGHVSEEYWRGVLPVDRSTVEELIGDFVRDLMQGVDGTGVKAGVIKAGTSLNEVTQPERRVLEAAGRAQALTGAPITTHTTDGTVGEKQVGILTEAGAQPGGICIGHLDRHLNWDVHLGLAKSGVYLGYDCISKEKYEPDHRRVDFVLRLTEEGHEERILLSGDMARRSYLESWGGSPGYRYIIETFVPRLLSAGLPKATAHKLLVENPARFLTWDVGRAA